MDLLKVLILLCVCVCNQGVTAWLHGGRGRPHNRPTTTTLPPATGLNSNCSSDLAQASAVLSTIAGDLPRNSYDLLQSLQDVYATDILAYPFAADAALLQAIPRFFEASRNVESIASRPLWGDSRRRILFAVTNLNSVLAQVAEAVSGIVDALQGQSAVPVAVSDQLDLMRARLVDALAARNRILNCFNAE